MVPRLLGALALLLSLSSLRCSPEKVFSDPVDAHQIPTPPLKNLVTADQCSDDELFDPVAHACVAYSFASWCTLAARSAGEPLLQALRQETDLTECHDLQTYLHRQTSLNLAHYRIENFRPLRELNNLTGLHLAANKVRTLSFTADLRQLTWINLAANGLSDSTPGWAALAELATLQQLYLGRNSLRQVPPLSKVHSLVILDLSQNPLIAIDPARLPIRIQVLDLSDTGVTSLSHLNGFTYLHTLKASGTPWSKLTEAPPECRTRDQPLGLATACRIHFPLPQEKRP